MKINSILIIALISTSSLQAIAQNKVSNSSEMKKLELLIGDWEGTGWYQQGQNERLEFRQIEHIESKLSGTLLLVEGKGYANDSLVFNALAMFTYTLKNQNYTIESHLADGKATVASGFFNENGKFIWGFEVPQGHIRYTMTITESSWNEFGEYSSDGTQWWKFMEMNLTKK